LVLALGNVSLVAAAMSHPPGRVGNVMFLTWVLLGATLVLAGTVVAYIERRV
jgi:hypothetical protein